MSDISKRGVQKIKPDVLAVLSNRVRIDTVSQAPGSAIAFITGDLLEREIYVAVTDVLSTLGGQWNRRAKGHTFDSDPTEALEAVIATGEYIVNGQIESLPESSFRESGTEVSAVVVTLDKP